MRCFIIAILLTVVISASATTAPPTAYKNIPKILYVWNPTTTHKVQNKNGTCVNNWTLLYNDPDTITKLLGFAKAQGFTQLNLFLESSQYFDSNPQLPYPQQTASLIQQAKAANIQVTMVWYLNDPPTTPAFYNTWRQWSKNFVDKIVAYNKANPNAQIHNIQMDQEPTKNNLFPYFIGALKAVKAEILAKGAAATLKSSATISPSAIRVFKYNGAPLFQAIIDNTDYAMLMDYVNSSDLGTFNSNATTAMNYSAKQNKKINIAIETGYINVTSPKTSYVCDIKKNPTAFYNQVVTLNNTLKSNAGYGAFVIHDYAQFYNDLNGQDPYTGKACSKPPQGFACQQNN